MRIDDAFPLTFLGTADVTRPVTLTIDKLAREKHRTPGKPSASQQEWLLHFIELEARAQRDPTKHTKRWSLSRTTFALIADVTGQDDSDNWHGCRITLFPSTIGKRDGGDSKKRCIGVRRPTERELAAHAKRWEWVFGKPKPGDQGDGDQGDEAEADADAGDTRTAEEIAAAEDAYDQSKATAADDDDELGEDATTDDELVVELLADVDACQDRADLARMRTERIDPLDQDLKARVMPPWSKRWNELRP